MAMDRLFQLMKDKNASDMFFAINSPIHLKINGNLLPINQQKMDEENIMALLAEVLSAEQIAQYKREMNSMLVLVWRVLDVSAYLLLDSVVQLLRFSVLYLVIFLHSQVCICHLCSLN